MPGNTSNEGAAGQTAGLQTAVGQLQRTRQAPISNASRIPPLVFSFPGTVVDAIESGPWYPDARVTITGWRMSATTPASSGYSTIELHVNGSWAADITLAPSDVTAVQALVLLLGAGDYVTVVTNGVGTDLADLTVELSMR